jgi:predicted phage terminase large subunit-like protein
MNSYSLLETEIQKIASIELSKRDVWEWCLYYDNDFFTKRTFLKVIAYSFQWLIQKEETPQHIIDFVKSEVKEKEYHWSGSNPRKIGVSLPPRAGKSYVISACSAWALGKFPKESIMRNSCTDRLYQKFSYDIRDILKSDKFKSVFNVRLSKDKTAVSGWNTTEAKQVSYFGAGVGGTIIGFGASLVALTDDLYKDMFDALSPATIERVKTWKESAHDTRLEKECPQLDIGTRWTKKDVLGQSEKNNEYDLIIRIPALVDNKSFCEDVKTTKEYLEIKDKIDKALWSAGYQQKPAELEGAAFPLTELKRFKLSDIQRKDFDLITINYTDVADQGKDYLSSPIGLIMEGTCYIVDVCYTKKDSDFTHPELVRLYKEWNIKRGVFESNNQGLQYTKNLKKEFKEANLDDFQKRISAIPNSKNKHSRIVIQAKWVINNIAFLDDSEIKNNKPYQLFLEHLTEYMKDKPTEPDDAADSIAGLSILSQKYM